MTERDPLLVERQKTHGDFGSNAILWTRFMQVEIFEGDVRHRLALAMIYMKLSRILSGQAGFKDHWDDIAGYAKLGAEACKTN